MSKGKKRSLGITKKDLLEYIEALSQTQLATLADTDAPDESSE